MTPYFSQSWHYLDENMLIASHCLRHTNRYFTSICTRPYVCPCGIWYVSVYLLSLIFCTLSRCGLLLVSCVKKALFSCAISSIFKNHSTPHAAAAAAKLLQSCPTLCEPINGSPPGSPVPGILQARTLEWVAISFSKAWKWKVKVKSLSRVWLLATPWTAAYQAPPSMGFSRQEYWSGVPLPSPTLHPLLSVKSLF